jgi:crossover junction endodeoxyribonuclease RuvC
VDLRVEQRLNQIAGDIESILSKFVPEIVAVEELYSHYTHPRTAILMGHARGVILQKCAEAAVEVKSFSATRIKKTITGNGRASKQQIQRTIQTLLSLAKTPEPSDVARIIAEARLKMPGTPLALGCMRPKGMHRALTDVLAVEAGVNGIAFPAEEAIHRAETFGLETSFLPICCSQIFEDFRRGTFTLSRTH